MTIFFFCVCYIVIKEKNMSEKRLILIEKSKDDILSDLLMCNAKKLLKYYNSKKIFNI